MFRMSIGRPHWPWVALVSLATLAGCSDGSATPIDTKATIQKATGGDGQARQSAKAKAASEEAVKLHPKLH